jgi:hypothetical protein
MKRCESVTEVWGPNSGCREFMSGPEEIPCGSPATHQMEELCWNGEEEERTITLLCKDCAAEFENGYSLIHHKVRIEGL